MTPDEKLLWHKISSFPLDDREASFKFSQRLAAENGWDKQYTARVIAEYRKFIFMSSVSDTGVTPSDPVDQAWHLHLTFTRSYWVDLCRNTIGKDLHHNPTKGGASEAKKFNSFYNTSRQLYINKFGVEPPADIWHDNLTRFTDIKFQRVNLNKYWLIRKPDLKLRGIVQINVVMLIAVLGFAISENMIAAFMLVAVIGVIGFALAYGRDDETNGRGCGGMIAGGDGGCNNDGGRHGHHSDGYDNDGGDDSGCSTGGDSGCSSSGCSSGCGGGGD